MEKQPPDNTAERGAYSTSSENAEIIEHESLCTDDIETGDKVLVTTASGNRYGFVRSTEGRLKVLIGSEGDLASNNSRFFALKSKNIATKGKPMLLGFQEDGDHKISSRTSTDVVKIEIRKGIDSQKDKAVEINTTENLEAKNQVLSKKILEFYFPDGFDPETDEEPNDYRLAKKLEGEHPEVARDYIELINATDIEEMITKLSELNEKYSYTRDNETGRAHEQYRLNDWGQNKSGVGQISVRVLQGGGISFGFSRY
jgi:hypothetical protein